LRAIPNLVISARSGARPECRSRSCHDSLDVMPTRIADAWCRSGTPLLRVAGVVA